MQRNNNQQRLSEEQSKFLQAVKDNNISLVKKMIASFSDGLAKRKFVSCADDKGNTPLMYAAQNKQVEITKELLAAGCDVHAENENEETALFFAVRHTLKPKSFFSFIKSSNANENTNNHLSLIKLLIENGALVDIKNKDGKTLFSFIDIKNNAIKNILEMQIKNEIQDDTLFMNAIINDFKGIDKTLLTSNISSRKISDMLKTAVSLFNDSNSIFDDNDDDKIQTKIEIIKTLVQHKNLLLKDIDKVLKMCNQKPQIINLAVTLISEQASLLLHTNTDRNENLDKTYILCRTRLFDAIKEGDLCKATIAATYLHQNKLLHIFTNEHGETAQMAAFSERNLEILDMLRSLISNDAISNNTKKTDLSTQSIFAISYGSDTSSINPHIELGNLNDSYGTP